MPSYLITGASRGLGLAFATELLKNPENHVIASARNIGAEGLTELVKSSPKGKIDLLQLDVFNPASVNKAVEETSKLLPNGLDVFVSNAGVDFQSLVPFEKLDLPLLDQELHSMISGTINLLRSFLPLVRKGEQKKIIVTSSELGSIEKAGYMPGLNDAYSVSRAALNMLIRKWGGALKLEGVTAIVVHPGWVPTTEIGSGINEWMHKYAPDYPVTTIDDSAKGIVSVITGLKLENAASFFNFDGTIMPW